MPSISIFDSMGTMHHITSSNPKTIAEWLIERMQLCFSPINPTIRMEAYPQEIDGKLDWPMDINLRSLLLTHEDLEVMVLVLEWIADGRPADHQKLATLFNALSRRVADVPSRRVTNDDTSGIQSVTG